jgi:hypothetical protein
MLLILHQNRIARNQAARRKLTTSSPAAKRAESEVERACERNVANGAFGGRVQRLVVTLLGC